MRTARLAWLAVMMIPALANARYPKVLPGEIEVRRALQGSPQVMAARAQVDISAARQRQLSAGNYEWTVAATGQRRTDPSGLTYSEQSYELSRGIRLWGKAGLDSELGRQTMAVGEYAFSDNWHEASRMLMTEWFDWLRASHTARLLRGQTGLLEQQLATVESRVRAGDAPRIERVLAQTELDRQSAVTVAAERQEQEARLRLLRSFPDLTATAVPDLDNPEILPGSDEDWMQRILGDNHELQLAQAQQQQARTGARRAARDRLPDPTIGIRYSNNFDGNRRVIGLIVSLPLGGPARSAASAAAAGEASVAAQHARDVRLKVESDVRRITVAMRSTFTQWQQLQQVALQSQASAQTLERGYSLGEFTISELLVARRQSLDAELAATLAQLDALEAAARLQLDAHEIWTDS